MATQAFTEDYTRLIETIIQQATGSGAIKWSAPWTQLQAGTYSPQQFYELMTSTPMRKAGYDCVLNADGSVRAYTYYSKGQLKSFTYEDIANAMNSNVQSGSASAGNSFNATRIGNTSINTGSGSVAPTGNLSVYRTGQLAPSGSFATIIGSLAQSVVAAGVGIQLGKTIDGAIYNIGNALGFDPPESLNPATWGSITQDNDSWQAAAFNALLGIDQNGDSMTYVDQNAFAYMAQWLAQQGFFITGGETTATNNYYDTPTASNYFNHNGYTQPIIIFKNDIAYESSNGTYLYENTIINSGNDVYGANFRTANTTRSKGAFVSDLPFSLRTITKRVSDGQIIGNTTYQSNTVSTTYINNKTGKTLYYYPIGSTLPLTNYVTQNVNNWAYDDLANDIYQFVYNGQIHQSGGIDGVGNQDSAILPDTTGWTDPAATLNSLQNQYPDLWDNRIENDVVQPDGTTQHYIYIPMPIPSGGNGDNPDTTNDNQQLQNPTYNPNAASDTLLNTLLQFINQTMPQNMTEPSTDTPDPSGPSNPTDTGDGTTPPVVPPTGGASSLWAVYNPTQAQVDDFGAWLWSSNFVEQIKKLFSDPMQGIIGLHKIFATPSTGAAQNIKVGYLDSGVPSAIVTSQYTDIDCGTVNVAEYFGNVFDYEDTTIRLYLPFIGIVDLSTSDVMRGSVRVVYHVDVITGACLADVIVSRDSAGGVLYQYSGDAAVRYPVSSGSYMGMVSGVLAVVGGVIGLASGGAALPAVMGAVGGVMNSRTSVKHSGSFSGAAGAMGAKIPYLIIERPQSAVANDYINYQGIGDNRVVNVGSMSGYFKMSDVHTDGIALATDEEIEQIKGLLEGGVIQ